MKTTPVAVAAATVLTSGLLAFGASARTAPTAPPPAPGPEARPSASSARASASTRITVEKDGNRTTVEQRRGCTTVRVCPGNRRSARQPAPQPKPAPQRSARRQRRAPQQASQPVPPPPPAAPAAPEHPVPAPPPKSPAPICPAERVPQKSDADEREHLFDPARTRLGITGTAEVLGHGEWEIAARGLVGLLEVGVGLGDRFQLSFKTSPITWFVPGIERGLKNALWMGEIKAQLWRSPKFKLTAELSYFHVDMVHGVRPGLSMKIGGDTIAFHAAVGAQLLILPRTTFKTCGAVQGDAGCETAPPPGCSDGARPADPEVHPVAYATAGFELRFFRYGKFFLEGFVAGAKDSPTIGGVVPGVRFHNGVFAADLGIGILKITDADVLPLPVLNFSWRW